MFINTLPIIFTFTDLLKPIEFALLLALIFLVIYFNANSISLVIPSSYYQDKAAVHGLTGRLYFYALAAWLGDKRLAIVFWPFFIFINAILYYIDYRITNLSFTIASWKTVHIMVALPIIWWIVSVWRCSLTTPYKAWKALARSCTIYLLIELLLRFIILTQYPNTFFDCQLLVVYYGDCF
jgi:hypothetical protein